MTNKEAIDILKLYQRFGSGYLTARYQLKELDEAIAIVINALEAKQQPEIVPIGTKVRVTKVYNSHYDIGDILTVIAVDNGFTKLPYRCQHEDGMIQWLSREEFEIIEP